MIGDREWREELAGMDPEALKNKDNLSFLAGFLVLGGELSIGRNPKVTVSFRNTDSAILAVNCLWALYAYRPELSIDGGKERKRSRGVSLELPTAVGKKLLVDCKMLKTDEEGNEIYTLGFGSMRWVKDCRYLAALALEAGRLYTSGEEYRFDLSLSVGDRRIAELESMLAPVRFGVTQSEETTRLSIRREAVADFFTLVGATKCSLEVTEYYLERNINRSLTREMNCRINNMDKSYAAATEQLWAIEKLKEKGEYQRLPPEVQLVGDMRLKERYASLRDIAKQLGLNATAVYRRMSAITSAAEKYKGE